jgi:hypothetical protein
MLYRVLLGQEKGPRFGSFVAAYGIPNTIGMIDGALARSSHGAPTFIPPAYRYRLYFDETGIGVRRGENQQSFSVTGLVIRQDVHDKRITEQLTTIKHKIFGDKSIILHRREIVGRKGAFGVLRDPNLWAEFNSQITDLLRGLLAVVITVSIDKKAIQDRKKWPHGPYHYAFVSLLEQFVLWLDQNDFYGDVMGEARNDTHDAQLRRAFRAFYKDGTTVEKDIIQSRLTSRELGLRSKRANVAALQVADLLAHPAHRIHEMLQSGRDVPAQYDAPAVELLDYRNKRDEDVGGWIRKWFPRNEPGAL